MQPSEEVRNRQELRRAFVAGAKWWEYHTRRLEMELRGREIAQTEAEKRYGKAEGKASGSE